ncbi:MAG TPA: multidrug efflux SMR transporter [Nitrospira sp.]|nr:multidrug efflux SMR transporter [Nitrospira sp.]
MAWWYLIGAGLFEIVWASSLKFTEGFTKLWPTLGTLTAMIVSVALLAEALKTIPVGTGYAVWTGVGAAGTAAVGMLFFGESKELIRLVYLLVIVGGIVGLKLSTP